MSLVVLVKNGTVLPAQNLLFNLVQPNPVTKVSNVSKLSLVSNVVLVPEDMMAMAFTVKNAR